jgi:aryl-alcohol dehydrogenase-like predicted oxidoreductase
MLRRLRTDRIDLLYQHRVDREVPIEIRGQRLPDVVLAFSGIEAPPKK